MKFPKNILFVFLFIAAASGIFFMPEAVKIKKIECLSQFGPCSTFLQENLGKHEPTSLKKGKKEISDLLRRQIQIQDFSLRFKFPSTLTVRVLEKKARLALKDNQKGVYATIDEDGSILALFEETNLPYVEVDNGPFNTGEKVSEAEVSALKLQERLYSAYQVRNSRIVDGSLVSHLPQGFTVYFPLNKDPEELIGALTLILSSLNGGSEGSKIEVGTSLKTIDLRFKNPVLK